MIALSSSLSRRAAEKAIVGGRVSVNGEKIAVLGTTVDPRLDRVMLDSSELAIKATGYYIAYNKPRGVLVTKSDPHGRPTVWDDLANFKDSLNSVGRLDFDSEGLLLLTNDGDFLNKLTHPRHEIWKTYRVRVKGEPTENSIERLKRGIELKDGKTLPAKVKRVDHGDENAVLEISIREGRNREVRRMCDAIHTPVIRLKRIAIGPVKIGRLKPGEWRYLKPHELETLL